MQKVQRGATVATVTINATGATQCSQATSNAVVSPQQNALLEARLKLSLESGSTAPGRRGE